MTHERFSELGDLYQHIGRCIAHLVVFDNGDVISEGTGFAFSADGCLMTAAHVVAGGFPVKKGEVDQASRTIIAFFVNQGRQILYKPAICPVQIDGSGLDKPLQLDVAVLMPTEKPQSDLSFLTTSIEPPKLGDAMYFGGYSDEVEMPFLVDRSLSPRTEGLDVYHRAIATGIKARMAGPIIKHGMVGNVVEGRGSREGNLVIKQTAFYLDNQVHYGASGGPIVGRDGVARGVISKRMVTTANGTEVPAGSTLGLGFDWMLALPQAQQPRAPVPG